MAARQYAKALQGKTDTGSPSLLLSDHDHNEAEYIDFLEQTASNPKRPKSIYLATKLPLLVLYGHNREAVALGEMLLSMLSSLWSERLNYSVRYYLSLAYMVLLRDEPEHSRRGEMIQHVQGTLKLLEAGLQHQVLLHQLVGALHKRLQKELLVKRTARGATPKRTSKMLRGSPRDLKE